MNKIIIDDSIDTNEESKSILTDEIPKPKDGKDGVDGKDGRDGKDGKDGKDGRAGSDGKNGSNGSDGKHGKNGRDGVDGLKGKNGSDGRDGEDGIKGDDGSVWFLFMSHVDEKKGKDGDLCLVQTTSNYYRREQHGDYLIWKFKGNLQGKQGEKGERGFDGSSYIGGGNSNPVVTSSTLPFAPLTKFSCGKLMNLDTDDFNMISCCELPATTDRFKMDMGALSELCN